MAIPAWFDGSATIDDSGKFLLSKTRKLCTYWTWYKPVGTYVGNVWTNWYGVDKPWSNTEIVRNSIAVHHIGDWRIWDYNGHFYGEDHEGNSVVNSTLSTIDYITGNYTLVLTGEPGWQWSSTGLNLEVYYGGGLDIWQQSCHEALYLQCPELNKLVFTPIVFHLYIYQCKITRRMFAYIAGDPGFPVTPQEVPIFGWGENEQFCLCECYYGDPIAPSQDITDSLYCDVSGGVSYMAGQFRLEFDGTYPATPENPYAGQYQYAIVTGGVLNSYPVMNFFIKVVEGEDLIGTLYLVESVRDVNMHLWHWSWGYYA